jgi:hypothetical protein
MRFELITHDSSTLHSAIVPERLAIAHGMSITPLNHRHPLPSLLHNVLSALGVSNKGSQAGRHLYEAHTKLRSSIQDQGRAFCGGRPLHTAPFVYDRTRIGIRQGACAGVCDTIGTHHQHQHDQHDRLMNQVAYISGHHDCTSHVLLRSVYQTIATLHYKNVVHVIIL